MQITKKNPLCALVFTFVRLCGKKIKLTTKEHEGFFKGKQNPIYLIASITADYIYRLRK
jgi:hypothetical protein